MNQKPMDLISLEIHIHLEIRGEPTQTKYICDLGTARTLSTLTEPWPSDLHTQSLDQALYRWGGSGSLLSLQLLRDQGLPVSSCATKAMSSDPRVSCLLAPQGHSVIDSEKAPIYNLNILEPDAVAGTWGEPLDQKSYFPQYCLSPLLTSKEISFLFFLCLSFKPFPLPIWITFVLFCFPG